MTVKFVRECLRAALIFVATTQAVLAATVATLGAGPLVDLQWGMLLMSFIICTLSGVASLLQRISKELGANPGRPLAHPSLFIATNMLGSWVAGLLAYVMGQILHWDVWSALLSMIIASYTGAVFIELVVSSRMPVATPPAHLADPPAAEAAGTPP